MIDLAIIQVANSLNQYLKRTFDLNEDVVAISNIVEQDGNVSANVENMMTVFLINVEKVADPSGVGNGPYVGFSRSPVVFPPVHLNLYLMFAANFGGKNYPEALKFISNTVGFFQSNPVFDHQNSPELDGRIEKLILDIENLDIKDLSSLWSILSGKYLPSVLYKVRMLTFDSGDLRGMETPIRDPRISAGH